MLGVQLFHTTKFQNQRNVNIDVHSCETSETATVSKKYNDLKDELAAVLEHSKSFEELCKGREGEFSKLLRPCKGA